MSDSYLPATIPDQGGGDDLSYLLEGTEEERPLYLGPPDDPEYRFAPKFDPSEVLDVVKDLQALHDLRIRQSKIFSLFLDEASMGLAGYFKEDEDLIDDDLMEMMPLLGEAQAHAFRVGFIAMHEPYPRLLNRDALDHSEAMVIEDLVSFLFQAEERQYEKRWGADLRSIEVEHLLRASMLVGYDGLNPNDTYCGLDMDLCDPLTCFPVFGGSDGLDEMYRVYETTNNRILGAFGGKPGYGDYDKLKNRLAKSAVWRGSGANNRMDRRQARTVAECWNRDEFALYLCDENGDPKEMLIERKHGYHFVPFTVSLGCFDAPPDMSIGDPEVSQSRHSRMIELMGGEPDAQDLARTMRPFGYKYIWSHHIAEAVAGRRLSFFKWAADPAKVLEFDPSTEHRMAKEADLLPGQTLRIPLPNKLNIFTPVIDPNVMAGLSADLISNVATGALTMIQQGAVPPQTSGSALSKLVALGGAGEAKVVRTLQSFKRARSEKRLHLIMTYGDAIGKPLGSIAVPAQRSYGRTPLHAVTPDMIERAGCQIDVDLHHWQPDVALAQYLATLRSPSPITGKPLISDLTARKKLKATPDVEREEERIEDEALTSVPPIQMQKQMARLAREIRAAQEAGDDETAEEKMTAYVELEHLYLMAIATGQASPAGIRETQGRGLAGAEAGSPAAPAEGTEPVLPGNSMTDMGGTTGTEGGRPPASTRIGGALTSLTGGQGMSGTGNSNGRY